MRFVVLAALFAMAAGPELAQSPSPGPAASTRGGQRRCLCRRVRFRAERLGQPLNESARSVREGRGAVKKP